MKVQYILILILIGFILMLVSCTDLKKDLPVATSGEAKIHDKGWADTSAINFHGKYLKTKNWETAECKPCHGSTYDGGTSGKSCFGCHSPFPHEVKFVNGISHKDFMISNNFPLEQCKRCHGDKYIGGVRVDKSCSSPECHASADSIAKSPEACNTCHGKFRASADDITSFAPPRAINGDTLESSRGVGAHQKHLLTGTLGKTVKCSECHLVPKTVLEAGHIDVPFNVSVLFNDTLANTPSADGLPNPSYHYDSLKCSNTFCHGNWKLRKSASSNQFIYADSVIVGNKFSPLWTGGSSQANCGTTCHNLPPAGHIQYNISVCSSCHSGIIDNAGNIIDRTKHINGKINVFGTEKSFQ